jgi:hypothetical protein
MSGTVTARETMYAMMDESLTREGVLEGEEREDTRRFEKRRRIGRSG